MRVAIAQFSATEDKPRNRARTTEFVHAAGDSGADLVVLPEAAMHPFRRRGEELADVAEPLDGPFVTALADAARAAGVTAVAGLFEAVPGEDRAWNTVVAVGPDGRTIGRYRKLHLFDALGWGESEALRAGALDADALLTFGVGELTVGVMTCYDVRFPELARALTDAGATLLAIPAAWVAGPLKEAHWTTLVTARALENTCYVAAADQGPRDYAGRSLIVDPMGIPLAQLGDTDGLAVADATAERVDAVRKALPVLEHRRYRVVVAEDRLG